MFLQTLHLRQFRNYADQALTFQAPKIILVGENAQGKSNVLEAVELLSTLRSHRTGRDQDLVLGGEGTGRITAMLDRNTGPLELTMALRSRGGRTIRLNGEILRRHLDCLGSLSSVQFSSLDLELVRGGPEQRRQWLDGLLSQLEPLYAYLLQEYSQVLRQRNSLLRAAARGESPRPLDPTQLSLWDAQLVTLGVRIIRRRHRAVGRLAPIAHAWHGAISGRAETLRVDYAPNLKGAIEVDDQDNPEHIQRCFFDQLWKRRIPESHQGTTLVGPHRDDVALTLDDTPARQYGSQGQQRTLVLALKLAELELLDTVNEDPPLLLLDDVLAELDPKRQHQLLLAIQERFQTFITATHLKAFDAQWLQGAQVLSVRSGKIFPVVSPEVMVYG